MTASGQNRKAFVTGASGLIGSALVHHLVANGYDVTGAYTSDAHLYRLDAVRDRIRVVRMDLCDPTSIDAALENSKPEIVFHVAAAGVHAEGESDRIIRVNVEGSAVFARAAIRHGIRRFVYTGSGHEYEPRGLPMDESVPLRPLNLYCASKSSCWQMLDYLCRHEGFPLVTVRPFSVFGPMERETKLIPMVVRKSLAGETIELTSGLQIRDYVFVDDVADALRRCAEAPESAVLGEVFNVGAGQDRACSVREMVMRTIQLAGAPADLARFGKASRSRHEAPYFVADFTKIAYRLGWYPTTALVDGLTATIDYIRSQAE
ncbi:NAD(P)-dependent oxidoreductase [bacterium]|nr:NAD(P)-dependent oxidoreductase [bacterium]